MYWKKQGKECTQGTLELAVKTAKEKGINRIIVASNSGYTAKMLLDKLGEDAAIELICVTHAYGFKSSGENEMAEETRNELISKGVKVFTGTHLLSGAERAFSSNYGGIYPVEVMANTLRMFSQGVKVCVEISVMAMDAGLLSYGQSVVAIGGTGSGADSSVVIKPAHGKEILNTKIEEIICMP